MKYKYKDIVKEILRTLYNALLDGTAVDHDLLSATRFGVSEKCMVSIFEELIDTRYIKHCEISKSSRTLLGLDTMEITLSGVEELEFLEDR